MERVVHWGDCAPSGAVFYPTYYKWFDEATWDFFTAIGLPIADLGQSFGVVGLPLVGCDAEFQGPCCLGDRLLFETTISHLSETDITILHRIRNKGKLAVIGHERRFWGVRRDKEPSRLRRGTIPQAVLSVLMQQLEPGAG